MIRTCLEYSCASSAERNRKCVYRILAVYWQDDPTVCTRLLMHRCINLYASHGQNSYHCQFVVPSIYLQSATANRCSIDRAAPGPVLRASLFQQAIDVLNLDYINVNRWYPKSVITDPHTCEINELLKASCLLTSSVVTFVPNIRKFCDVRRVKPTTFYYFYALHIFLVGLALSVDMPQRSLVRSDTLNE